MPGGSQYCHAVTPLAPVGCDVCDALMCVCVRPRTAHRLWLHNISRSFTKTTFRLSVKNYSPSDSRLKLKSAIDKERKRQPIIRRRHPFHSSSPTPPVSFPPAPRPTVTLTTTFAPGGLYVCIDVHRGDVSADRYCDVRPAVSWRRPATVGVAVLR